MGRSACPRSAWVVDVEGLAGVADFAEAHDT
jgi:hypothetical protein